MTEPLGVAAGLVGLATAALKISKCLLDLKDTLRCAPAILTTTEIEVQVIAATVKHLERYLFCEIEARHLDMISVESFRALIADCVQTFSLLQMTIDQLLPKKSSRRLADHVRWLFREKEFGIAVDRLQRQKLSLSLLLNTLSCIARHEAVEYARAYEDTVDAALRRNEWLSTRFIMDAPSGSTLDSPSTLVNPDFLLPSKTESRQAARKSVMSVFFEDVLSKSPVYCKSTTSHRYTWSSYKTNNTLADVSIVSVADLPLYQHELANSDCYSFKPLPEIPEYLKQVTVQGDTRTVKKLIGWIQERREAVKQRHALDDKGESVAGFPGVFGVALPLLAD